MVDDTLKVGFAGFYAARIMTAASVPVTMIMMGDSSRVSMEIRRMTVTSGGNRFANSRSRNRSSQSIGIPEHQE